MATRGIRGATTVERNDREQILAATRELLEVLVRLNGLRPDEIGWTEVPLMCGREIPVPGAIAGCIRVLIDWNTSKTQREIRHAFLHRAKELRPAWAVEV
jgi:chorismate mutase